jgi:hypothetical protein
MEVIMTKFFVLLCVLAMPVCAFSQDMQMQPIPGYAPGSTAGVPPMPQPMYQPHQAYPAPIPIPMAQPMVVQSANDSAMLEAVKQGKGFNLRVDLIDPNERQYQYQYQYQQPVTVTPYQCPQQTYCQPRQYYDSCGRPIYWDGYRWRYYQQQSYWYPGCNLGF